MLLKYANFTVVRKEKEIVISRGLIEKHQITIPLQRIQAIKIKESLIRQPFGLAAVTIVSAGGNVLEEDKSAVLFPIISKKMIKQRLGELIPDYAPEDDLNRLPKRALRRYILRASWTVLAVVPLSILFPPWGYLSAVLIPFTGSSATYHTAMPAGRSAAAKSSCHRASSAEQPLSFSAGACRCSKSAARISSAEDSLFRFIHQQNRLL